MKQYIYGYYCANDKQLDVISKQSNRRILEALREASPLGLNAHGIVDKTGLPLKTVYASLRELNRELFVDVLGEERKVRGRPLLREVQTPNGSGENGERHRTQYIIEDRGRTYEMQNQENYAMAPGNVDYPSDFVGAWHTIVPKEEENELCVSLLRFLERVVTRMSSHASNEIRKWIPERCAIGTETKACCGQCGINHEARDFTRAMLLHLVDHFERHDKFIEFMKNNNFLDIDIYQNMVTNIEKFEKFERVGVNGNGGKSISLMQVCSHFTGLDGSGVKAFTSGCMECEKENKEWVGLRLCLTCGHVGCCDASKGMHATKHFVNTAHPVIVDLPDKAWRWCYVDKIYG